MKNMKKPYVISGIVEPDQFYGRQTLAEDLLGDRHQCVCLFGNRRSGKSSLIRYLELQASCVSLVLDLQFSGSDWSQIAEELLYQINLKIDKAPALRDLRPRNASDLADIIRELTNIAESGGFKILLLWDEAEMLLSLDEARLMRLRSALQDRRRTVRTILLATKRLAKLQERCRSWDTSPFLHGFLLRYIPPLRNQEASDLICQVNNEEGMVDVDQDVQTQIMALTGNQPYLIQLLCYRLFDEGKLRPVDEYSLVVDDALANIFQVDYESLSPSERHILHTLSEHEWQNGPGLRQALSLGLNQDVPIERLHRYLFGLEQAGYVRRHEDQYQIANHFLLSWLRMGGAEETSAEVSDSVSLDVLDTALDQQKMEFRHKAELTEALLKCACMRDRHTRDTIVASLPDNVRSQVNRSPMDRVDVLHIVNRCLEYRSGLDRLIEIVRFFEEDALAMEEVERVLSGSFGSLS